MTMEKENSPKKKSSDAHMDIINVMKDNVGDADLGLVYLHEKDIWVVSITKNGTVISKAESQTLSFAMGIAYGCYLNYLRTRVGGC